MLTTTDITAAWRQDSPIPDDTLTPRVADLLVRHFADHGIASEVIGLGGGYVGVHLHDLPGVSPEWTVVVGLVEDKGWWIFAEADVLTEQPPVVLLGQHEPGDAVSLIREVAPRLQREIGVDHSLSLADLDTLHPVQS